MNIRFNPLGVESAGSPDQAMDLVSLGEQEFGQVGPVLAGDTGNQCAFQLGPQYGLSGFWG